MKKYLFLFTISPVQAFIAQARKAQDLYAGSQLLSDLVRFSIERFNYETNNNSEIRFPKKWQKEYDAALPNRFLAELEIDENKARNLGKTIEEAVHNEFRRIANDDIFENHSNGQKKPKGFDFQIKNHLIINWIFEELENKTYFEAYQNIESNLGAIKNIRKFKQLPETEKGRKDSLTGELNALFFNDKFEKPAFSKEAIKISAPTTFLSKGEGLSAVSFMKRFYKLKETKSFLSTAEITLLNILQKPEINSEIEKLKTIFKKEIFLKETLNSKQSIQIRDFNQDFNQNFDYQYCFEENINEIEFPIKEQLKKVSDFYKKELKSKIKEKLKYYAVLIFDGDDMGKWLSGDKIGEAKNNDETLKKYHKAVSKILANFAENLSIL